jgi:hypothetical protein
LSEYDLPGFKWVDVYNYSLMRKKPEIPMDGNESKLWKEMSTLMKECSFSLHDDYALYSEFRSKFREWTLSRQAKNKSRDVDNNIGTFTKNYCDLENFTLHKPITLEKPIIETKQIEQSLKNPVEPTNILQISEWLPDYLVTTTDTKKFLSDLQQTLEEAAPITIAKEELSNNVNHRLVICNKDVNTTYTNFIDIYASLVASPSSLFLVFFFMPVFLYVIYFTCKFLSFRSKK